MPNKVIKKYVFYIRMKAASPVCVSGGDGDLTDKDIIRDYEGTPFIPGSSLAGAMRAYLNADGKTACIFGNAETGRGKEDDRMSSIFVSDLIFDGEVKTTVRDSVRLSDGKTAETGAKFDMEIIDTGVTGNFTLEMVIREQDDEERMCSELRSVIAGFGKNEIRLGTKKTRGYGEMKILSVKKQIFDASNILDYAKAYDKDIVSKLKEEKEIWLKNDTTAKYISIMLPLELEGCISIRQYAAKKNLPDYVHITANGKPVIPGTAMTGALRHRVSDFLKRDMRIDAERSVKCINRMFGYVTENPKASDKAAHRSGIVVSESVLEGSTPIELTRNGISRFESGAKNTALFKELSYYGGRTCLKILVEKSEDAEGSIGLLYLALRDLGCGLLSIGGQGSVGKGIFQICGEITIDGKAINEEKYLQAAAKWIGGIA